MFALFLLSTSLASAADTVRTVKASLSGTIESTTADAITLKKTAGSETIPINEVLSVRFDGEPPKLNLARAAVQTGQFADALATLDQLAKEDNSRDLIKLEIAYYQAVCAAKMALADQGNPRDAGKQLRNFLQANPTTFHFYDATMLLGDLFAKLGSFDNALAEYAKLDARPWPDFKMRAGIARAAALRAQQKNEEALAAYEAVLQAAQGLKEDKLVASQRLAAQLGRAETLADMTRYDEGVKLIEQIIADADPEAAEIQARAYNVLGKCLRKADRNKDALLAYLHVDVLYYTQPQAHAEALRNLVELWTAIGQPERAAAALQTLEQRYASKNK
jgi:tetratricopeptide (TPR) repeat protein